ncbi:MAG: tetratricopeptide repeat protein [bacterium]|nr:tetratricopeptide repeat protein [bacterium]
MSDRLTRKEIKHQIRDDEVRGALFRVFDYIQENPGVVVGVVVGFLVLVLALTGTFAYLDSRAEAASEELASALKIAGAPVKEEGATPDDPDEPSFATEDDRRASAKKAFEEVRGGVGSSVAGEVAELYLADVAASEGDTETARRIWSSFLDDHEDHALALSVRLNLIHLDRQNGRAQEVADELQRQLDSAEKPLPEDVLLYELARTLEALDQRDEALDLYQRILDDHPKSPFTAQARQITTSAG